MTYQKAKPESLELRVLILDLIAAKPGMNRAEVRTEVAKTMTVTNGSMQNAFASLVDTRRLRLSDDGPRKYRYFIADDGAPMVRIIQASTARRFAGPVRAPMEWCLHQLQGATA